MNPDFIALLRALSAAEARYLVVGAYAVTFHSRPRSTGDLDLWIARDAANAGRVVTALREFGAPLHQLTEADLQKPDLVFQLGVPPRRIDILTTLTALDFEEAWTTRVSGRFGDVECPIIGHEQLIRNKRALGRPRDLADLELLNDANPDTTRDRGPNP